MPKTAHVTVKSGLLDLPAYLAMPDGPGPHPGVVLLTEWAGLNEEMRAMARRVAAEGIACLVHEPFAREAGPAPTDDDGLWARMVRLRDNDALADVGAATNTLRAKSGIAPGRIGVVGCSMGGRLAILAAARVDGLQAAACLYGTVHNPVDTADDAPPKTLNDLAGQMACPVLGLFGGQDPWVPVADVQKLDAALSEAGLPHTFTIFEEAGHGFLTETGPNCHPDAARAAWAQLVRFLRQHL